MRTFGLYKPGESEPVQTYQGVMTGIEGVQCRCSVSRGQMRTVLSFAENVLESGQTVREFKS